MSKEACKVCWICWRTEDEVKRALRDFKHTSRDLQEPIRVVSKTLPPICVLCSGLIIPWILQAEEKKKEDLRKSGIIALMSLGVGGIELGRGIS